MKKAITELEKVIKYAEHTRDTHELMKDEGAVYTLNIKIGVLKHAIRILKGWE